jgi:hypothetical protein
MIAGATVAVRSSTVGVPATQVARWTGHSVEALLKAYVKVSTARRQ